MPVYVDINWHKLVFDTDWQKLGLCRHFANPASRPKLLTLGQILRHYAGRAFQELSHVCFGFILAIIGTALDRSKWRSVISPKISIFF